MTPTPIPSEVSVVGDERLQRRIANIEADLAKNISAKERAVREEGLALLRELVSRRSMVASEYHPQLIHYDGEGDSYWEIVNADTPTSTDPTVAANVEFIRDMNSREVIGLRVYTALSRRSLDTADGVEPVAWVTEPSGLEVATIAHDDFSLVEVVKSPRTNAARRLTIHLTSEETGRRDDMSIDLTAPEARKVADALASPPSPAQTVTDALRHAFRNADESDWSHLFAVLPDTGRGKFWQAVMAEARTALQPSKGA